MACCSCCEKTGACCYDGVCSQTTCADCEGVFQGVDTVCVGEDDDECPCDPPADPGLCEKCVDGEVTVYCPEARPNCCDGVCQAEECECEGPCDTDEDCSPGCVCVDGECVPPGFCCFKDTTSTYSFTFLGYSGTVSGAVWFGPGTEYFQYFCTTGIGVCGSIVGDGVDFHFFDGTDNWEGWLQGNATTWPCESATSLVGTYTLTNCTTSATSTLTFT